MYSIKNIYKDYHLYVKQKISINGWIRNCRFQKKLFFIDLNDGTFIEDLQIVYKGRKESENLNKIKEDLRIGACLKIEGEIIITPEKKQPFEFLASNIIILGKSSSSYPIQPKKHSKNFLRQIPHLRLRTKIFGAIFRIRNTLTCAIHDFFQKEGFLNVHTPIITSSDGEGAGDLFQITTLNLNKIPFIENSKTNKKVDYKQDFFGKRTFLTVTGQLEAEAFALAFSKVYTFGPTFRAEISHTTKHISEFWMIEPEIAFCNLHENINIVKKMLQSVIHFCLEKNPEDFNFLNQNVDKNLIQRLKKISNLKNFPQITYKEAIDILLKSQVPFVNKPFYGMDLANEHEKFLTDVYFQKPVFVTDWPKEIKAFYMKNNPDNQTVAAMDLLVPKLGELIGGSQREEKLDILEQKMKDFNISQQELKWYLELRYFGSCIHSGFGVGLERLLIYLTGIDNIRDVIAFPKTPK